VHLQHRCEQSVQVRADRAVDGHRGDTVANQRHGGVQLALATARDEHVRALVNEPLRGRESDTAAAAGDHRDLAIQSCHQFILIFVVVVVEVV
jgi:hypothetical protein